MTPEDSAVGPTLPLDPPTFPSAARSFLGRLGLADADPADTSFTVAALPTVPGFELLGELGVGGMGVVYQAREVALNRVVALKMIRPDARPTPRDVARFRSEAEAVAAVRHPNVVEVYSTGTAGGRPYFVMEYVGGGTLAARLAAGPLPPRDAAATAAAVARGVHAAHEAGIVHRDVKPGNVLLQVGSGQWAVGSKAGSSLPTAHCPLPTCKVSDFGLAKWLDPDKEGVTKTLAVLGTPAYMAPEQARGRGKFVGPEADVYGVGGVLYQCLTGRPPFDDADPLTLLRRVDKDDPVPPRALVPAVPRDLDLICRKCLAKDAADRYPSAAELADDLDRFLAGEPVKARPISCAVRAARWVRRNPQPATIAALLLLAAVFVPAAVLVVRAVTAARDTALELAAEKERRAEDARRAAELVGLQAKVRRAGAERPGGWTWHTAADARRAAALAAGNPAARADLRTAAATALLAADLRLVEPVAGGFTAQTVAASPDGSVVALGQLNAWGPDPKGGLLTKALRQVQPLHVRLVDPATGRTVRDLSFPAAAVYRGGNHVPDRVMSLAFSPDGKRVFAGTRSLRVVRLDVDGPPGAAAEWAVPAVPKALAADATTIAAASASRVLRWDARTGETLADVPAGAGVAGVYFAPDGGLVAAVGAGLVRVPAGATELKVPPGEVGLVRPTPVPGAPLLVATRGCDVELWDAAGLRRLAAFADADQLDGSAHADDVTAVAVHPSGAYAATAAANRVVKVWALASGRRVATAQLAGTGPAALAWSGDGRFLVATNVGHAARFEFAPPAAERFAGLHAQPLAAAAPDGAGVVALGEFDPDGTRLLFRTDAAGRIVAEKRVPLAPEGTRPGVAAAAGAVAFTSTGVGVGRWDGPPLGDAVARCPKFTPDGSAVWAVFDSDGVRAWDAATGVARGPGWANEAGRMVSGLGSLDALAVGRSLGVVGGEDGAVYLLGPAAERRFDFPGAGDPVRAVALTPADDIAAAGTRAGKLRLIRLTDRVELPPVVEAHPGGVTAVSFSADGTLLATGGRDRAVRFWKRVGDGFEPVAAVTGLPAPVRELSFAREGAGLVVLLAGERAVRVWDVARLRAQLAELGLGW